MQILTVNELEYVAGGEWSWGDFAKTTAGGAVAGALAGGVGALPGAEAGFVAGV